MTNARQEKLWFQFSRWNTTRSAKYKYTIGLNPECKKMCSINWFYFLQRLRSSFALNWQRENLEKFERLKRYPREYLYLYKYCVEVLVPSHLRLFDDQNIGLTWGEIGPLPQCFRPAAKKIKSQCIIRNNGDSQISGNFWFEIVTNILNALFSCKFYIVG